MIKVYETLIKNHFYNTREELMQKLGVASAVNIITDIELAEVMQLVDKYYPVVTTLPADHETTTVIEPQA